MRPITRIHSRTAVLVDENIDTDRIIPARFLTTTTREGLGKLCFHDWRYQADGSDNPAFPLNQPKARGCSIIVAGRNFGCGSSREHAAWALADAGFRVVIAPSFGDIFYSNSFKNGLLPVVLPEERCAELRAALGRNPGARLVVDLEAQTVTGPIGVNDGFATDRFDVEPLRKELLLAGEDEIGFTLRQSDAIAAFETGYATAMPWV
jgi:3-isopropylmalate/(R)-2-methylmalate dehydratase small subunit